MPEDKNRSPSNKTSNLQRSTHPHTACRSRSSRNKDMPSSEVEIVHSGSLWFWARGVSSHLRCGVGISRKAFACGEVFHAIGAGLVILDDASRCVI
jgi:hypothetical protein